MRLIELKADNFKRLKAVSIKPDNAVTPIVGKNGQGKTSVLDAVCAALGGAGYAPELPIRVGEDYAEIVADLDEIVVRRKWTQKGDRAVSSLEVLSKEGAKFPSPQAILDKLYGDLSFDPLAFGKLPPGQQAATLAKIAGLDLETHEGKRRASFDQRTEVNRQHKAAAAQLDGIKPVEAPDEEISVTALAEEISTAQSENSRVQALHTNAERIGERHAMALANVEKAKAALKQAELTLRGFEGDAIRTLEEFNKAMAAAKGAKMVDLTPLRVKLSTAEDVNRKVRAKKDRAAKSAAVAELKSKADALTARLEECDKQKAAAISSAKLPVPGLALGDNGVLLEGIPFSQCSGAQRLRTSVAIGLALNPKLRLMLIRDGSLLDAEGMTILAEIAEQAKAQVLIERVDNGSEIGVVIVDGEVTATRKKAETATATA